MVLTAFLNPLGYDLSLIDPQRDPSIIKKDLNQVVDIFPRVLRLPTRVPKINSAGKRKRKKKS
jgi:hypothetical protein